MRVASQPDSGHSPSPTGTGPRRKRRLPGHPAPQPGLTSMLPTVRAQPTTFSPCWTRARATAAPMPPEAPVTSASRSRHRSMPPRAISLRELGTWTAELGPRSQGIGRSPTVTAAAAARPASSPRLEPPPTWPACGRDSTLLSSTVGHISPEGVAARQSRPPATPRGHGPAPSGPASPPAQGTVRSMR